MMTSTFPSSRSNHTITNGLKEIQSKKEALMSLENALKKRVNELKELCLKEGELTGHLPIDYPLQPREPIPQIRRRHKNIKNNNLNDTNSIASSSSIRSNHSRSDSIQPQSNFTVASSTQVPYHPSRPTSTNSSSSSISTASSNTRSIHNAPMNGTNHSNPQITSNSSSSCQLPNVNNNQYFIQSTCTDQSKNLLHNGQPPVRYDPSQLPNHFKRPFNMPSGINLDTDSLGHMRASSTASSSSSSGSGTSSNLQNFNIHELDNFQSFYEETKPFQMSDFYKYSSKFRQKVGDAQKTTRQLQEEVLKKNSLRFTSCDDQRIQASVKLIEKSGQKLMEATAKAIAGNPGLAEKFQQYATKQR